MMLPEIQTNLLNIIQGISAFAPFKEQIVIEDGAKNDVMETALNGVGFVINIMPPVGSDLPDKARGAVKLDYSTTIWVRTNPKILNAGKTGSAWNPLDFESWIIPAVLAWSRKRDDFGFTLKPGDNPETDWMDIGNYSRLIMFLTAVNYH